MQFSLKRNDSMFQIKTSKDDYNTIQALLPDICPDVSFSLKSEDTNLYSLGFSKSVPCIIEFDIAVREYYDLLDKLGDIETDAFNTPSDTYPRKDNPAYQKYLKYSCLYTILSNAEMIFFPIGKVKYIGKSFGVDSLSNNKEYSVIDIEVPFLRIVDDSGEDYLYSILAQSSLENPDLFSHWEITEDTKGLLKSVLNP